MESICQSSVTSEGKIHLPPSILQDPTSSTMMQSAQPNGLPETTLKRKRKRGIDEVSTSARKRPQRSSRTYVYKITIDDGVAPCAPAPTGTTPAVPTLAICKPAIRRTAQPGDRIFGITSKTIAKSHGYPLDAVIYSAVVSSVITSQSYATLAYSDRLDSIYTFSSTTGHATRRTATNIHPNLKDQDADLGVYPSYKNAHVLLCTDFRYFGSQAVRIPTSFPHFLDVSLNLGRSHRVFSEEKEKETAQELEVLAGELWERETKYTSDHLIAGGSRRCAPGKQTDVKVAHTPDHSIAGGRPRCGAGRQTGAQETKGHGLKGRRRSGGC